MLKTKLSNGLTVLVEENHACRVASMQVWVGVGSADESEKEAGLAHVHEHMLFKGTDRRGLGEIAAEIEAAGGDINAYTSYDQTVYYVTIASREANVGLDILADAVQHSKFDPEELTKELEVVLEEVRRGKDTPSRVMSENLFREAFRVHTYGRPVIGYEDTIKAFDRPMILDFYRRWYRPGNMTLVVAGDVSAADVVARAERLFVDVRNDPIPAHVRPIEPVSPKLATVTGFQDVQESHLGLGWHGVPFKSQDAAALDILTVILGSGDSSRLYRTVKRDRKLVNDCYAYDYTPLDAGLVMVGANVHGDGIEAAFRAVLEETYRMKHEPPADAEIEKARTILLSEAIHQKETVQGIASRMGMFEFLGGDASFEETYLEHVKKAGRDEVRRVAERYLKTDALTVSALMPRALEGKLGAARVAELADDVESTLARTYAKRSFTLGPASVAKVTLQSGATLLVREDRAAPIVSVRAVGIGGLLAEDETNNGVSHLVGELLVRGTEELSAEQISEEVDAMAAGVGGVSGRNSLGMAGTFLAERFPRGLEILAQCLFSPSFPEEEIELEKKTQIEDIASRQDSLATVCFDQLARTLWTAHPYRLPTIGTKESVEGLDREKILAAYRSQLRPDRLTFAVVGAVDVADTIDRFERWVGNQKPHADAKEIVLPSLDPWPEAPRAVRVVRDKAQAHLALGFPGLSVTDERRFALEVLSSILAGQGGRLFLELRDKQSLAYSVTAASMEGLHPGYFAVYIGTAPEKVKVAEDGMLKELAKVLDGDVYDLELERAKRYLIGAHEIGLQRTSSRASSMAINERYGIGYDELLRYEASIQGVTKAQIRSVARDLIRLDRVVRSLVDVEPGASS
ncbi:MAG: insulinase family protein [Deltaproteobacteria bacterium]|nr:insulinase family protein [Deltaproteobacteria bacterium]